MFGNKSLPSRIYSYGAKCGPIENADECYRQLRDAHRYRNRLVELEKNRRRKRDEAMREMFPQLKELEAAVMQTKLAIEAIDQAVKNRRAGQNTRLPASPEEKRQKKALKERLANQRHSLSLLRKELRQSEEAQRRLKEIDAAAKAEEKAIRATCSVFWGTYLQIEQSVQQAKKAKKSSKQGGKKPDGPQFRRFTGDGKLAVQLQRGISLDALYGCQDSRIRMEPLTDPTAKRGVAIQTNVWFRIGSEKRKPIWAKFIVSLDRPLPEGCTVKWVFAVARRVGTKTRWSIQFVVSQEQEFVREGRAEHGSVALDIGWRMTDDGLRVAYLIGDDGEGREVQIPAEHMRQWAQVEDLRSIRDMHFNEAKEIVAVWRDAHKERLPEWFAERTSHLRQWRSPAKLAALALAWRKDRITGDDVAFAAAEAWRTKDKHLYEWEANLRRKAVAWRKDFYRCLAAELSRKYKTAVIEDINIKESFAELPPVEKDEKAAKLSRRNRTIAAHSELREALEECFGADLVKVDPKYTSRRCHACGMLGEASSEQVLRCEGCGVEADRDSRACWNLLGKLERLACVS